ncbi:MAG: DUF4391 family protein [Actinobacteria bacterium]|uniref:Unannotated protein n=1 Tax=freshwater metagenome TaxID=449393 RepID=A0A6J5ZYB7_9ZZZZ|nr:DUF4391 family protein [Actinomycetota bacterium]
MTGALLYRWPAAAKFGRVVPKTKFYEHTAVSATVRGKFVADVQRITWAYKLADATIHLRGNAAVPEIQVFVIDTKDDDVSNDVLTAIDKAVHFPIIFELRSTGEQARTRMVAAHKQLGGPKMRLSAYFSTGWQSVDAPRAPLPLALDLPALYAGLLEPILPIAARPGERLSDATSRIEQAREVEREIAALERRLRAEPQLNRKVELRRQLRDRTATLTAITGPATPKTSNALERDTPWTN